MNQHGLQFDIKFQVFQNLQQVQINL